MATDERSPEAKALANATEELGKLFGTVAHEILETFNGVAKAFSSALDKLRCGAQGEGFGPCLLKPFHGHDHLSAKDNGVKAWR